MVKKLIIFVLFWMVTLSGYAENIKTCEGNVTKIDEYQGGLVVIWLNGEQCGNKQRFWIREPDQKSRGKLMSIIQAATGTGRTVIVSVNTDLTLGKFDGRFDRLEIKK